ncbi:MAG TPA: methyltransferase domain-containing protein, partial [Polyangiales bacterium]
LAIGELAELLREGQPNVSRHVAPLKKAGLLQVRKHGTRVLARLSELAERDAVVQDGVDAGRRLCEADGSMARVAEVLAQRDEGAREFFGEARAADPSGLPSELPAYLTALAPALTGRKLAVDAGTGAGMVLDVLAPLFEQVIAIDREPVQLELAARRLESRSYANVELVGDAYDSPAVRELAAQRGGADVVFASRVLHHAPRPQAAVDALSRLLNPEGALVVLDYGPHEDESMREREADLWLGFSADELGKLARRAGLNDVSVRPIPRARCGTGPDSHLAWHCLIAKRA